MYYVVRYFQRESEVDSGFSVPGWATGGSVGRVGPTGDFRSEKGRSVGKFSRSTRVLQIFGSVGRFLRPKFAQKRKFCLPRCARQGSVGRAAPCRNGPRPGKAVGRWVTLKPESTSLRQTGVGFVQHFRLFGMQS